MEWVSGGVYILKGWMMQMNYMRELTDREGEREGLVEDFVWVLRLQKG